MTSFPLKKGSPSDQSQLGGNKDNSDYDDEIDDIQDDGAPLPYEEKKKKKKKIADQEAIMFEDLGLEQRDRITKSDVTRAPQVSLSELQRGRAVNESGSEANRAFMANSEKIGGWNNLHAQSKDDDGAGDLDNMMDGQSHRARLHEVVENSGGQRYDLHGTEIATRRHPATHSARGGTAGRRSRGGGVIGTRGRGGPASSGQSTTCSRATYRPLDPAVEQGTGYGLGRRRDLHRGRGSRQDSQPPARANGNSGRGGIHRGTGQDVRGSMEGTTVRVTAASTPLPRATQLAPRWATSALAVNPSPPKKAAPPKTAAPTRIPSDEQNSLEYKMLLSPAAFLAAIASTKDREVFNRIVDLQPNRVPAPKAAEIIAKSSKNVGKMFEEVVQSTSKPVLPPKAAVAVADLSLLKKDAPRVVLEPRSRKHAPEDSACMADERKATILKTVETSKPQEPKAEGVKAEEMLPANVRPANAIPAKQKVKIPQVVQLTSPQEEERRRVECKPTRQVPTHENGFPPPFPKPAKLFSDIDAWNEGLPSPGMSNFPSSPEHSPVVGSANMIEEENAGEMNQPSSATSGTATPVVGLGISDQSVPFPEPRASMEGDLLNLDTDEVVDLGNGASPDQTPRVHGALADLVDLDFDFSDAPHEIFTLNVLEPEPEPEPLTNSEEHPEYVDIGSVRYFREDQFPRAVPPRAGTGDAPTIAPVLTPTDRLVTGTGYSIGVSHLGVETDTLLGERNLARRMQETPAPSSLNSIWAESPARGADVQRQRRDSVRVPSEPTLETSLHSNLTIDSRPATIGERNLPGRSEQAAARGMPVGTSDISSGTEGRSLHQSAQRPLVMPREANPWGARGSVVATTIRSDNPVESRWGERVERAVIQASHSTTDGQLATRVIDRSSETATSTLSRSSIFSQHEAARSSPSRNRSSTSGGVTMSITASSSATVPKPETEAERTVCLTNSWRSNGMTPFAADRPVAQSRPSRSSMSSTGHSRSSSRSQSTTGKSTANLGKSKWAAENAGSSSTTVTRRSTKPAGQNRGVLNPKEASTNVMRPLGKTKKGSVRTNAGSGLALLMADHETKSITSNSPADGSALAAHSSALPATIVAPTTRSTIRSAAPSMQMVSTSAVVATPPFPSGHPTTLFLEAREPRSGYDLASEPRLRVVNTSGGLDSSQWSTAAQRGEDEFKYRDSKVHCNDSDDSSI